MNSKQEPEGGYTANEMRTDYARSHVWPQHASELEHRRTDEVHTFEDGLRLRADIVRAGDRKSADMLVEAAHRLDALADKLRAEKREHRDTMLVANTAHNERETLERRVRELTAEIEQMRDHLRTLEGPIL